MADLVFADGCDLFDSNADIFRVWDSGDNNDAPGVSSGRFGRGALTLANIDIHRKVISVTTSATVLFGAAIYMTNTIFSDDTIYCCRDSSTNLQMSVKVTATNKLQILDGDSTVLGTSTEGVLRNTWYMIQTVYKSSAVGGIADVYVNGVQWINFDGDTQAAGASATPGLFDISSQAAGSGISGFADDITVWDVTAGISDSVVGNLIGDYAIETVWPDGDTADEDFARSAGSDSYALLDEQASDDGDTTYIQSDTPTDQTYVTYGNLSNNPFAIVAVVANMIARKDLAGPRTGRHNIKSGASVGNGQTVNPSTSYMHVKDYYKADPATSAQWLAAAINAIQSGPEVVT